MVLVANNNKKPINFWLWQTYEHGPFLVFVVGENDNKNATSLFLLRQEINCFEGKKVFL